MPPKIVYGKKRPTVQQQASFSNFLSPVKGDILKERPANCGKRIELLKRTQQKSNNNDKYIQAEYENDDGPTDLQREFAELGIEGENSAEEEVVAEPARRTYRTQNTKRTASNHGKILQSGSILEDERQSLSIDFTNSGYTIQPKRRGRPAKKSSLEINVAQFKEHRTRARPEMLEENESRLRSENRMSPVRDCIEVRIPNPKAFAQTECMLPIPTDIYSSYVSPLLQFSDRKTIRSFVEWSEDMEPHLSITKIAEATYSEVYRLSALSKEGNFQQESVLKVIALKTPSNAPLPCQLSRRTVRDRGAQISKETAARTVQDEWKSHVVDVVSEVKLIQNLNHIPGFTVFRDLTIVQGRPSKAFGNAWTAWNKARTREKKSDFPDPLKKASYDDKQMWAVIEMQDAGTDCEILVEDGRLASIWEVWDVFWGVCLSVAKAEEACQFEHRDLHLGNICVRMSQATDNCTRLEADDILRRKLHFTSLETTVIDYTLSRAEVLAASPQYSSPSSSSSSSGAARQDFIAELEIAYLDLNKDLALFEGDAEEDYQYEMYRHMRGVALHNNPLKTTPSPFTLTLVPSTPRRTQTKQSDIHIDEPITPRRSPRKYISPPTKSSQATTHSSSLDPWRSFHPQTNLLWAHFLLHKLLTHIQYKNTPEMLSTDPLAARTSLDGEDAVKVAKKGAKLYKILQRVSELVEPKALSKEGGLESMKELVVRAMEERWLRVGDVEG